MAYIRCWECVGNGIVDVVKPGKAWGIELCSNCKGTGADYDKTIKYIPEGERTFPKPLILR